MLYYIHRGMLIAKFLLQDLSSTLGLYCKSVHAQSDHFLKYGHNSLRQKGMQTFCDLHNGMGGVPLACLVAGTNLNGSPSTV